MEEQSLFPEETALPAARLAGRLRELAAEGVLFGTSSWKYEGWLGQIYRRERYTVRGRFSSRRFQDACLAEYAEVFPIVCGDFTFYQFPSPESWERLFGSAPAALLYAFKAPEEITAAWWPRHARYGDRSGSKNENFLNADLLKEAFLRPLWPHRRQVAAIILEFGAFPERSYARVEPFVADLDAFLAALPPHFRYSVEIRNPEFLAAPYLDCLRHHNAAHVFNAWARMPELGVQIAVPEAFTADFTVTRALLKRGRDYENAVNLFQPYDRIQEPNPAAREALRAIARRARQTGQPAYIFVNNRLEGNAPGTIEAVVAGEV
jgi:uncharacterized protein YecE (DUF72 family)